MMLKRLIMIVLVTVGKMHSGFVAEFGVAVVLFVAFVVARAVEVGNFVVLVGVVVVGVVVAAARDSIVVLVGVDVVAVVGAPVGGAVAWGGLGLLRRHWC